MAQLKRNCVTSKNYISNICTRQLDMEKASKKLCDGFGKKLPKKIVPVIREKVSKERTTSNLPHDYKPCSECKKKPTCPFKENHNHSCFNPER